MDIQEKESKLSIISMGLIFAITVTAGVAYYLKTMDNRSETAEHSRITETPNANRIASLESSVNQLGVNQSKLSGVDKEFESSNAALRQQIAAMEKQIATLTESIQNGNPAQPEQTGDGPEYPGLPIAVESQMTIDQIIKKEEEKAQLRDQLIAATHTADPYDDIWAGQVTQKIQENFNNPALPEIKLTNTDCRTTMCLVQFEAPINMDNKGEYDPMYENELISGLGEEFPSGTIKSIPAGENLAYTLYLARSGHTLPGLEDENPIQ